MRLIPVLLATALAAPLALSFAGPSMAQQLSPMTGTTAGPGPAAAAPGAPPATTTAPATTAPAPATGTRTAPTHHRATMKERFEAANTTHDGKLTLDQAKAGHMVRVVKNFDAIDTGRKGYVSLAEIHAYNRAQAQARKHPPQ